MGETTISFESKRIAVVTGGNKGIGYEISRQLAAHGVGVLDVTSSTSIASPAEFLKTQVGKRDILVIPNEKAKRVLGDTNSLIEEEVDNLVEEFMEDVKQSLVEAKGWPAKLSAYIVSKAALNDYTRVLAKTYPNIAINAVDTSFTRTDKNKNTGVLTVKEGAKGPLKLALSPDSRVSGLYFEQTELSTFD
ncbi:unnamed protein product [Malus baccata var. baccata]